MSISDYKRVFSGVPSDFRCRPESRPSWGNVRFPAVNVSFTLESGLGAPRVSTAAFDPGCVKTNFSRPR
jgi:hypothetical protein